jgi:RNA polymerase sigma factor (sigma-70 family)
MSGELDLVVRRLKDLVDAQAARDLPDRVLLHQFARRRDEPVFMALVARHGPLVWKVCRQVLGHEQDAEDAFQATFLVLARKAHRIKKPEALAGWLHGVAMRIARKVRSREAKRRKRDREPHRLASLPLPAENALEEMQAVLHEELDRLPKNYRLPLVLCYLEGRTRDEAAETLGWSPGAVKGRLERGRELLRQRLKQRGFQLSAALLSMGIATSAGGTVPAFLCVATVRAAMAFATPLAAAKSAMAAPAVLLAEGALKAMLLTRWKIMLVIFLCMSLASAGAGMWSGLGPCTASTGFKDEHAGPMPPTAEAQKGRTDLHGDPLPPGALTRLGTIRFRHGDTMSLKGLVFLPDGKTLLTATNGHEIFFWERGTGRLLRTLRTDPISIGSFTMTPDAKLFAVAGLYPREGNQVGKSEIRVFAFPSGQTVQTFARAPWEAGQNVALSPDGKLLFSFDAKGVLRIEEIASGTELFQHKFPRDILPDFALSPDGKWLALASGPNTHKLFLWNWQDGVEPRSLPIPWYGARWLSFSPDNKWLATVGDVNQGLRVWDVKSGKLLYQRDCPERDFHYFGKPVFSPDGASLMVSLNSRDGTGGGKVQFFDPTTGRSLGLVAGLACRAVSPDSRYAVMGAGRGLRFWDLKTRKEIQADEEAHYGAPTHIVATAQGLLVTVGDDNTVHLWDATTGRHRRKLPFNQWVRDLVLSPDGRLMATSSLDDTVRLWDVVSGREIYRLPGHGRLGGRRTLAFLPDGHGLLSFGDDFFLRLWDVKTGKALFEHALRPAGIKPPDEDEDRGGMKRLTFNIGDAVFSHDGKSMIWDINGSFHIFDVGTGKEIRKFAVGSGGMQGWRALSPDSKYILLSDWGRPVQRNLPGGRMGSVPGKDHPIYLWDVATGKLRYELVLPHMRAGPVAFSPDGRSFATTVSPDTISVDKTAAEIRIYETASARLRYTIRGFRGAVRSLAFLPGGTRLASGMDDSTVLIWDLHARAEP